MLTKKQIKEIKSHLARAQNPIFFFDNDPDGLCSFLLLQRISGKGKGVPIKSFPELTGDYFRKVRELNADYIFILDKPVVSEEFFDEVKKVNIPVVWIDHHKTEIIPEFIPKFVNYYNPLLNKSESNEPVTYLCYNVSNKEEDLWLAVVGCISDKFVPDFYLKFQEKYPDLALDSKHSGDASDIFYNSEIGKIAKIFSFALKDKTTNVINMIKFLMKVKTPYEVLEENPKNRLMHKRFKEISLKYEKLLEKASRLKNGKLIFFKYGGGLSMSSDLANELNYKFPNKFIAVAYVSNNKINLSLRGKNIREITLKAIEGLENATGGGHEEAVGAKIRVEDLEKFKEKLENLIIEKY